MIENEKLHVIDIIYRKYVSAIFIIPEKTHGKIFILPLQRERVKNRYRSHDLIRVKAREELHVTRKDFRWRNPTPHELHIDQSARRTTVVRPCIAVLI